MQEDRSQALLSAALSYAKRGWQVVPLHSPRNSRCSCRREICASPAKHPRTKHGLKDATTDEAPIRRWWTLWRDANLGVCTGAASGLVVVDVDAAHGGEDSLADLERRYGALPKTVMARTGGGGRHLLFAHPGVPIRNKVQVAGLPGLDVRGDGGYIVAPPSVHISRRAYAWDPAGDPDRVSLAPLPAWLLAFLQATPAGLKPSKTPEAWRELVAQGAGEGARNVTIASLAGYLLHRGVDPLVTLELLQAWNAARNKPPLSAEEVAQVVESIAGREYRRRQGKQD
jgi:hypothetical protein